MSVSGNLKTMPPGDLLQWLSLGQKTGTLCVRSKGVEKKIFFRNGRVISSASNDPREYLGQFLMSHGYITEPELMKAMEVQAQSRILLGKILVMIDVINEEDLQRLMRRKAEEEIYDIFLWNEGEFEFIDDELPQMEMIPLQVDVTGLIMEGTRRVDGPLCACRRKTLDMVHVQILRVYPAPRRRQTGRRKRGDITPD